MSPVSAVFFRISITDESIMYNLFAYSNSISFYDIILKTVNGSTNPIRNLKDNTIQAAVQGKADKRQSVCQDEKHQ